MKHEKMKFNNSLMAFKEDLKSKNWIEWLKAHTSGFKPLHRYEGTLELNNRELIFTGKDVIENKEIKLKISIKNIIDLHYGFDEIFKRRDKRNPWNKPLRIKCKLNNAEKTLYFFINFHYKLGARTSSNKEVYEKLRKYREQNL